jgi:hypothetical protein
MIVGFEPSGRNRGAYQERTPWLSASFRFSFPERMNWALSAREREHFERAREISGPGIAHVLVVESSTVAGKSPHCGTAPTVHMRTNCLPLTE